MFILSNNNEFKEKFARLIFDNWTITVLTIKDKFKSMGPFIVKF